MCEIEDEINEEDVLIKFEGLQHMTVLEYLRWKLLGKDVKENEENR